MKGECGASISDSRACNAVRALRLSPELTAAQKTKSPEALWAPTTSDPTGSAVPGAGNTRYQYVPNAYAVMGRRETWTPDLAFGSEMRLAEDRACLHRFPTPRRRHPARTTTRHGSQLASHSVSPSAESIASVGVVNSTK